jgi:hypothetical protein
MHAGVFCVSRGEQSADLGVGRVQVNGKVRANVSVSAAAVAPLLRHPSGSVTLRASEAAALATVLSADHAGARALRGRSPIAAIIAPRGRLVNFVVPDT